MTRSDALTAASVRDFGVAPAARRSMPTSAIASTTAGLIESAGAVPAERTTTRPRAWRSSKAAAIWERPALWTQTKRTSGTWSDIGDLSGVEVADQHDGDGGANELHHDEHRRGRRLDAGEGVGQGAADGHRRVGEAGRRREEVGAADPGADGERHGRGAAGADAAVDDEQKTDSGHD